MRYVIGFGTGRSGTVSLAKLLNDCKNVNVSHEFRDRGVYHRLSWKFKQNEAKERLDNLRKLEGKLVGDVAHYYLNYLGRDAEETVKSFMKKSRGFNHWMSPHTKVFKDGKYRHIDWDRTFPKYNDATSKRQAISFYVNHYYIRCMGLIGLYPKRIFLLDIKEINNKKKQKELFDFLEIPEEDRVYQRIWENKS